MNEPDRRVCLQVNLHPLDAPHARHTLPHQLRVLGPQVDEVLLTVDGHHSPGSRYRLEDAQRKAQALREILERLRAADPRVRVEEVDYSQAAMREVAQAFLGGGFVPRKAENGSPFFAYLYGLHRARAPYVLHLDSDLLLGGGSRGWTREAVARLERDRAVLACNPLAGPPRLKADPLPGSRDAAPVFHWSSVSTRVMLLDRRRFLSGELRVPLLAPPWPRRVQAFVNYTPPYLALEDSLSELMRRRGFTRVDFLGEAPGLWSLHPVWRSARFYAELPRLIERVEAGDIPEGQRGHYDLNDAMFDWSEVRAARTWRHKARQRLAWAAAGLAARWQGLAR